VIREHTKLLVDLPVDVESDWGALLRICGSDESYASRYSTPDEVGIVSHLMADIGNPTSVIRTVAAAKENLRVTRQLMPASLSECVNRLHTTVATSAGNCTARASRLELASSIISSSQQIVGILASTISRDAAFSFYELGRNVERADMTTRVLDVPAAGALAGSNPPTDRRISSAIESWVSAGRNTTRPDGARPSPPSTWNVSVAPSRTSKPCTTPDPTAWLDSATSERTYS